MPRPIAIKVPTITANNGAGTTLAMRPSFGQKTMIKTAVIPMIAT